MTFKNALVVFSGGMDSAVLLAKTVREQEFGTVLALTFFYGAKHSSREVTCAKLFAQELGVSHTQVDLGEIGRHFSSSLLKGGEPIPEGSYADTNMKSTVVPFRNGIFLAFAVGFAESYRCSTVLIGSHSGDHPVYPDCRLEFTEAFSIAASLGTYAHIQVKAPFAAFSKTDIACLGAELAVDFTNTWTCYQGGKKHCGVCASCRERKEALTKALGKDPTEYQ